MCWRQLSSSAKNPSISYKTIRLTSAWEWSETCLFFLLFFSSSPQHFKHLEWQSGWWSGFCVRWWVLSDPLQPSTPSDADRLHPQLTATSERIRCRRAKKKEEKKKTLAGFIQTHCDKLTPPHTLIYCLRGEREGERERGTGTRDVWKTWNIWNPE